MNIDNQLDNMLEEIRTDTLMRETRVGYKVRELAAIAAVSLSVSVTAYAEPAGNEWGWLENMTCTGAPAVAATLLSIGDPETEIYERTSEHFAQRLTTEDEVVAIDKMAGAYDRGEVKYPELMEVAATCAIVMSAEELRELAK